jgi:ABC-2 type transport system permease protein
MNNLRILFIGGLTSYRALFNWLSPWVLIPVFAFAPLFQILLFAFIGRAAGTRDDSFFLIGNAVLEAAMPCLFAMSLTIVGERNSGTLALLIVSPAKRLPLFLGRALPVILNGFVVSVFALAVGALALNVHIPIASWSVTALAVAVCSISCTGLGFLVAAIALRHREAVISANIVIQLLLVFGGVNVPIESMLGWMQGLSRVLPMSHGIRATHDLIAGASLSSVGGLLGTELAIGGCYAVLGVLVLYWQERQSRRYATLEVM